MKPKVVKDYHKLSEDLLELLLATFPKGFEEYLIRYEDKDGQKCNAVELETEDRIYLIKVPVKMASPESIKRDTTDDHLYEEPKEDKHQPLTDDRGETPDYDF